MASSISISSGRSFDKKPSGRRMIFNGVTETKSNTRIRRRKISPLVMILSVLTVALIAVFFIWNKIGVNHLASEIDTLQVEYRTIIEKNQLLRADVSKKSRPEIIEAYAQEKLGLMIRKEQPVLFELEQKSN